MNRAAGIVGAIALIAFLSGTFYVLLLERSCAICVSRLGDAVNISPLPPLNCPSPEQDGKVISVYIGDEL